jgi:hypothetical protein
MHGTPENFADMQNDNQTSLADLRSADWKTWEIFKFATAE